MHHSKDPSYHLLYLVPNSYWHHTTLGVASYPEPFCLSFQIRLYFMQCHFIQGINTLLHFFFIRYRLLTFKIVPFLSLVPARNIPIMPLWEEPGLSLNKEYLGMFGEWRLGGGHFIEIELGLVSKPVDEEKSCLVLWKRVKHISDELALVVGDIIDGSVHMGWEGLLEVWPHRLIKGESNDFNRELSGLFGHFCVKGGKGFGDEGFFGRIWGENEYRFLLNSVFE